MGVKGVRVKPGTMAAFLSCSAGASFSEIRISDAGPIEEVKVEVAKTDGANS